MPSFVWDGFLRRLYTT